MPFLPKGYEVPKSDSLFMKFQQGANKFRIVSNAVIGYEYWNTDNKPVRTKEMPTEKPADLKINDDGTLSDVKHFWAFIVINRVDNEVRVLQITQRGIMGQINDLLVNPDWGDPKDYDLTVTRKGEKYETRYSIQPSPKKKLAKDEKSLIEESDLDIEKLIFGLKKKVENKRTEIEDEIQIEDIPFAWIIMFFGLGSFFV